MEQLLVYTDVTRIAELQRSVETVRDRCQELVDQFHSFQDWKKIETDDDFLELVKDPVKIMDDLLIDNVDIRMTGKRRPDPQRIADLFNLDRESWMNLVAGHPVRSDCVPCKKIRIRKGTKSITLSEYQEFQDLISFKDGKFIILDDLVNEESERYKHYTENQQQVEIVRHHRELIRILNDHLRKGFCGPSAILEISKILKLRFADNQLFINDESLWHLILRNE